MALSFAFDPSKGETPQTIAQRRQMSNLIAAQMLGRAPKNVGEGLNAIGQALIARSMMGEADSAQKAGEASLPDFLKSQITGQPVTPSVATPPAAATPPMGNTAIPAGNTEFVNTVMPLAQSASEKTGIDPRLITAQAALETGYGKSAPGNNLFGIKSHGQPGGTVLPTTEIVNGQPVRTNDSFMSYASPEDSANGYADFINKNPRYAPLKAASGLEAQAAALGQSGYATDPNYGQKVLQIAQGLPAPTGGVLADNSPSPLDNAQFPAGPVGAPTATAGESSVPAGNAAAAAIPSPAQTAQGVPPTTQAAPPVAQPQNRFLFKNASDEDLQKALINPFTPTNIRAALTQEATLRANAAQKAADPMRALDMQSKTLAIKKAQQDLEKPDETFGVVGQDPNTGKSQYGFINTKTGAVRPYNVPQTGNAPAGSLQDAMKAGVTGTDLYQYMPPDRAKTVKAMIEGRMPPPSTTAMRSPATMQLIDAANAIDPNFDATTWKTRSTFNQQFGSQLPSSIGGQKVLMGTALGHLGEVAQSAAGLGNTDGFGIAKLGYVANAIKNQTTEQAAKVNALNDKVAKFSGEVGKLYSGSQGGGIHEREDTRNRLAGNMTSAELASGLEAARDLIASKQKALEDQAATIFGPEGAKKFDFVGPEGRDALKKIDDSIMKLRGQNPEASQPASQGKTSSGVSWSIQ